jgi:WD40 repeat protein
LNHRGRAPFGLIFTSDGRRLITATKEHVRVWDLRSGRPVVRASAPDHLGEFASLALDPSETFVAVGQADYLIRFWRLDDGRILRTLGWKQQWRFVIAVAFSPDGKLLAAAPWETGPIAIIELWKLSP